MTTQEIYKIVDDYMNCGNIRCSECKASECFDPTINRLDYCYMFIVLKDKIKKEAEEKIKGVLNEI